MSTMNVCAVLAGCYRGKRLDLKALLTHYEVAGNNALCGKVQEGGLCDQALGGEPTCKACLRAAKKLQKRG